MAHQLKKTYEVRSPVRGQKPDVVAVCTCLHKEKASSPAVALLRLNDHIENPDRAGGRG